VGTLLGFLGGFDSFDSFLEFLFEGFLKEFSSFVEEEGFHVVENAVIGDEVALGEQGFEFGNEELVRTGLGGFGLH
jgi:hypothetical protein